MRVDIDVINLELSMADLDTVNNRIGKMESKARITKDKQALYEMPILTAIKAVLEEGKSARTVKGLTSDQLEYAKNLVMMKQVRWMSTLWNHSSTVWRLQVA